MRLLAVSLVFSTLAVAQTSAVGGADLSRGTTQLPGSTAWSDEATSIVLNPAGLGRVGKFNAWYIHERSNVRLMDNDGLWLATSLGDFAGLGLGFEWLRPGPGQGPDRAKTSLAFSAGPQQLSIGATINWFHGGSVQSLTSLDVGLQSRPLRWLSFGAFARNLNEPSNAISSFNPLVREWTVGVGLRPFGERVTVGVDWIIPEKTTIQRSRLQYTLQARIVNGVRLMGGFSHAFASNEPLYVHGAIGLDLEHFGYTQGVAYGDGKLNWQFAARFSADSYASAIPQQKIAVVSLGNITGSGTGTVGTLLGIEVEDRFLRFLRFLDEAARDPELKGVVLKVEGSDIGLARADEVRSAILKLRAAGKKVYAYVFSATDVEYLMISACDGLYVTNEAMLLIDGLRSSVTFFGGTAKRFNIGIDVARVGAYKNFPDQLTRADMSDEQRETINAYLDTNTKVIASRVKESRGIEPDAWQAAVDEGLKSSNRSVALRQFDGVMTPTQFDEFLGEHLPGARVSRGYKPFDTREDRWGSRKSIAIVPIIGNITGGKSGGSLLGGDNAGAESVIESINQAASDDSVAAIVLRVDSGGGDGMASDLIYRAVLEAKKKKPVVASMGDVAASGGYYVAMGADTIVASPTTLTGSIGVFFVKPSIKGLAEEFGVNQVTIARGKLSGITDLYEPWSDDQRIVAQKWVDEFYDGFITEVSASRKMTKEQVDAIARGRVWSGEDAKEKGLVDQLGGLMDAIALAREKAGVSGELELEIVQNTGGMMSSMMNAAMPEALLSRELPQTSAVPAGLEVLTKQLGKSAWILQATGIQARMEYDVQLR